MAVRGRVALLAAGLILSGAEDKSPTRAVACERRPGACCDFLPWDYYYAMLEDVREVCSGFTTIRCATQTTVVGTPERRAYFCYYTNLEYDGTSGVARCAPTRWGRDRRYMGDLPWKLGAVGPLAAANKARTVRLAADAPVRSGGAVLRAADRVFARS